MTDAADAIDRMNVSLPIKTELLALARKMDRLWALATHPTTPVAEACVAQTRFDELCLRQARLIQADQRARRTR